MRFDSSKYFKFTLLEDMEDLVGKTVKSFHEDNRDDYYAFLTDDNSILAFSISAYDSYGDIEVMDMNDISYTMNNGRVDSFYTWNDLINKDSYDKDYQAILDTKKKTEEEAQLQKEYQQYLNLKNKFENK